MDEELYSLQTQKFIAQHGPGRLGDYSISSKNHKTHKNLILFKYEQTRSPFEQPVVQECRGLILDADNNWRVIAYPYRKFFNVGEPHAAEIDWKTAKVYDKLDGSLCTLYFYRGQWYVASSGVPDATGNLALKDFPDLCFADLFWEIWSKMKYRLPKDTGKCYMFEMLSPRFPIVNFPEKDEIILHGVRDLNSLEEKDPEPIAQKNGWKCVTIRTMGSLAEVVEAAKRLNPAKEEGFVVVDAKFNRVKIKSPSYVALAHLNDKDKGGLNYRSMLDIIRTNESSEFLAYFPKWKGLHARVAAQLEELASTIQRLYNAMPGPTEPDDRFEAEMDTMRHSHANKYKVIFRCIRRYEIQKLRPEEVTGDEMLAIDVMDYFRKCDLRELFSLTEFIRGDSKFVPSSSNKGPQGNRQARPKRK